MGFPAALFSWCSCSRSPEVQQASQPSCSCSACCSSCHLPQLSQELRQQSTQQVPSQCAAKPALCNKFVCQFSKSQSGAAVISVAAVSASACDGDALKHSGVLSDIAQVVSQRENHAGLSEGLVPLLHGRLQQVTGPAAAFAGLMFSTNVYCCDSAFTY